MKRNIKLVALVLVAGVFFYSASHVLAEDSTSTVTRSPKPFSLRSTFANRDSSESSESTAASETARVKGLDRLKDARLKFCENHQDEINKRLTSLGNLVASMLGKFDAIAEKVEEYYKSKALPAGKVVSNYDALVADIATKRVAVETALTNSHNDVSGFSCTGENPKGQITLFRTDMQSVKKALQDYRTSIKNLIVAVKSPKPSASPI